MLSLWSILTVFMVPVAISGCEPSIPTSIKSNNRVVRVVDGKLTRIAEVPYFVQVFARSSGKNSSNSMKPICGGSILTRRLVLTAAHCLYNTLDLNVVIGKDISKIEPFGIGYNVVKRIIHPRYGANPRSPNSDDFGVIVLEKPLNLSQYGYTAQQVILANRSYAGRNARASGFGILPESASLLRSVEIPILDNVDCQAAFDFLGEIKLSLRAEIDDSMLCAGSPWNYKSISPEDSGGPLVVEENGQNIQVGIASWIIKANDDPAHYPVRETFSIFSSVAYARGWIEKIIAEED